MESRAFDGIAKVLGSATSRRAGLVTVLGAALGVAVGSGADARRREPKPEGPCGDGSGKDNRCRKDGQCCTGYCRPGRKGKTGRCRCAPKGYRCSKKTVCCKRMACVNGTCQPGRKIATGRPCTPSDTCENAAASCVAYALGVPAGTYCLLAESSACTDSAQCVTGNCTGICTSCTVCASGCDYKTIGEAWTAAAAGAVIAIAPGTYTGDLAIDKAVTFQRCGVAGSVEWQVADGGMALTMDGSAGTLTLKHLDFRPQGSAPKGAIMLSGDSSSIFPNLVADSISMEGFVSDTYSPIYLQRGGSATVSNSAFTNNNGYEDGGAIYLGRGGSPSLTLTNCSFTGNYCDDSYDGGAISFDGTTMTVTDCTFTGNHADTYGGAITFDGTTLTLTGCTFTNNSAKEGGGAILLQDGTVTIENSTFTGNFADSYSGGAIYVEDGVTLTMNGCTLTGNQAKGTGGGQDKGGGALYLDYDSSTTLNNTTVSGNSAKWNGGGIMLNGQLAGTVTLTLTGSTAITGNSVTDGAAGHASGIAALSNGGTVTITGADTRTTGNTTPPAQCERSTNDGASWSTVSGCAF